MNEATQGINTAIEVVWPLIQLLVTVFGPVLVAMLAAKVGSFLDIKNEDQKVALEQKIRFALHEAAENALTYAMARYGFKLGGEFQESLSQLARNASLGNAEAVTKMEDVLHAAVEDYLKPKMPDAISKLGASDNDLTDIVLAKIPKV